MPARQRSRAFDALISDRQPGRELENARELPLDRIRENPQQARQHFDEQALDELAESIRQHGILQPLVVRPDGAGYIIVAGERRWRAAARAGLESVPAIIREDLETDDEAAIVTALENLQREDLSTGDEARQYGRLLDGLQISQRELGRRLGIAHDRITRLVRILRDAPEELDAIDAGRQTVAGALAALQAPPSAAPPAEVPSYYEGTSLTQNASILQGGSSDIGATPPAETDPWNARVRTPRVEIDPVLATQRERAFKPPARFTQWAYHLQKDQVPPEDRDDLKRALAEAITAAETALRALNEEDAE